MSTRLPSRTRAAVLLLLAAYLGGLMLLVLWLGPALGLPALEPLTIHSFFDYGWIPPLALILAFLFSSAAPGERWLGSQFLWLAKSFLWMFVAAFAGASLLLIGSWLQNEWFAIAAIALWLGGGAWFLSRWLRGLNGLLRRQSMHRTPQ